MFKSPCISPRPLRSREAFQACLSLFAFCVVLCSSAFAVAQQPAPVHRQQDFGKVPLSFEPNRGQVDAQVQFTSRGQGYALYLTPGEAVLQLQKPASANPSAKTLTAPASIETSTLAMKLAGADPAAVATAQDLLPGVANYFVGNDSTKWQTAIPTYKRIAYRGVYPGVDLVYYGNQRELEYDFVVAPGADAAKIALEFTGAKPKIDSNGDLVLAVASGETRFHKPVVYQMKGDRKVPVEARYQIADGKVGFALGSYDHARALVIDPVLTYLTYIGGSKDDTVTGMAVDSAGSVYVVGTTNSVDYPVQSAYKATDPNTIAAGNPLTIFVSKFNATGTALVYSTYLGSSEYTYGTGVAVDPGGNAYVTGYTAYGDYPVTTGAYQTICGANNYIPQGSSVAVRINGCGGAGQGQQAGVLTKLNPAGNALVYSTYLSGTNGNLITAVAVDAAGEAYVTGLSNAVCPGPYNANGTGYQSYFCIATTANASETANNSGANADTYGFVVKFNAQGSGLLYSTLIANHNPQGHYVSGMTTKAIALDAAGNAYVTGNMDAGYFIKTTTGSLQPVKVDPSLPAFVAKFNPAGSAATSLAYSTYLSGTTYSNDIATGIAVDASGNAVVTGYTNSCTFPTTAGAFSTVPGGSVSANVCSGGFLSKLNAAGAGLLWSTYTGNNGANNRNNDSNDAVALASDGSVYVAGDEQGVSLSPTVNPILVQSESHFTYIKHFTADGSKVVFSSAIGGTTDNTSIPAAIYVDASNNIYLAGSTNSATYPTTAGAFQKSSANPGVNYNDGFVVKIAPTAATTTTLTLPSGALTAGQTARLTAKVTGATGSTGTPTGSITFLSGTSTLGTGTLDTTGTATFTTAALNATTYSLTASYPGDTAFSGSVSAAQNLVVNTLTPTVSLTAPATAIVGASVTLATTVSGTGATPTGTVTFKDGTATIGTATLSAGAASLSTTTLAVGAHSITVLYAGDSNYASATSAASTVTINVAAGISFAAAPTSLSIVHGATGSIVITATPVGGYTGVVSFTCGTLPTAAACSFAPASLTFTGSNTVQTSTLTVSTSTTTATLTRPAFGKASGLMLAALLMPFGWVLRRRKQAFGSSLLLLALAFSSFAVLGLSGCGGSSTTTTKTPTTVTTPAGSYTVAVTITTTGGPSTLNIPLTVQ